MADFKLTVRNLQVRITEGNQKAVSAVVSFTVGADDKRDNYTITLPDMIQAELDQLLREFLKTISQAEDAIRDMVVNKEYTIKLQ